MKQLIKSEIELIQKFIDSNIFPNFIERTKKENRYLGKFVENYLPQFFINYYILCITEEHKEEMQALPGYVSYKNTMMADSTISRHFREKVGNSRLAITLYDWTFFYFILNSLLKSYIKVDKFNDALFDGLYQDLESFLYYDYIPVTVIAPLINFRPHANIWNFNSLSIDNGLLIRKITNEEKGILEKNMIFNQLTFRDIHSTQYVIQYQTSVPKFVNANQDNKSRGTSSIDDVQKVLDKVIAALRLQHRGALGYLYIHCEDILRIPVQVGSSLSRGPFKIYGDDIFFMTKSDKTNIKKLYNNLNDIELSKNLALLMALERFSNTYSDSSREDKIIDFAISYEILFSKIGDSHESVSHKLAIRLSHFIADEYKERELHYSKIKTLYNDRSRIIHGSTGNNRQMKKDTVAMEFEEYMRLSLKKYIQTFKKGGYPDHKTLINELDFGS